MAYKGYIIKVELSETDTLGVSGSARHEGRLYIPKANVTKAYIQEEFGSGWGSVNDLVTLFRTFQIEGFGCPYFNKGQYANDLNTTPMRDIIFPMVSNCDGQEVSATVTKLYVAVTTQNSSFGLYAIRQSKMIFFDSSGSVKTVNSGAADCFGFADHYNSNAATAVFVFITSDNFVAFCSFYTGYRPQNIWWFDSDQSAKFIAWLESEENLAETDPYSGGYGGYSGNGGGGGNHDASNDAVPIPSLPILSATNVGFCTAYNPSISQLHALANYMWTDTIFDLDNLKKLFADPMDVFMSLLIVPVAVDNGGNREFLVGNWSTGLYMNIVANQYQYVDCGSVTINEFWGAYLDYAPYTKVELFLPFIGMVSLATDDVMGKTISIRYNIDLLTGACTAFVYDGLRVLYSFPGNCATAIPFSGNSYTEMIKSLISIGTTAAVAGWSAGLAASGESISTASVNKFANAATAEGLKESVKGGVNDLTGSQSLLKPTIQRTGSMGSSVGLLGVRTPYLIITRENLCLPTHQNQFIGYPSYTEVLLGSLEGFTIVDSVHLEGLACTEEEIAEIEYLLSKGVIF